MRALTPRETTQIERLCAMSRPRDRASAEGLLPSMEARPHKDGKTVTYRYHPSGAKPINLGTDKTDAIRQVLDLKGLAPGHGSLRWLWGQWQTSKRYLKLSPGTQTDYAGAWAQIDARLGHRPAGSITSPEVARYVHIDRAKSGRRADIEKTVMSNLFKHGIMLGVCLTNPTIGVEPHGGSESPDLPETMALAAFLKWLDVQSLQRRRIGFMAEYASLAGNRRCEFLALTKPQVDGAAGVIRTFRAKQRGRKRQQVVDVVDITPRMKALLARIYATLDPDCLYLFPTEDGNAYTDKGWKTLWQRCMVDAIKAKVIRPEQRFNFHALRHHYATMHKAVNGELPNMHADSRVTSRVYDHTAEERRSAL